MLRMRIACNDLAYFHPIVPFPFFSFSFFVFFFSFFSRLHPFFKAFFSVYHCCNVLTTFYRLCFSYPLLVLFLSFCLFILFMGFSRQEYLSILLFPSPMDHVLSELSTMTGPACVALRGMVHNFIELDKAESPLDCKEITPVIPKGNQS